MNYLVEADHRLPMLNSVMIPDGIDEARARSMCLHDYDLEIGAGLGAFAGKVWRIGLMGHTSSEANVIRCIEILETVLGKLGLKYDSGAGPAAVRAAFAAAE